MSRLIAIPYVATAKRSDRPLAEEYAREFAATDLWNRLRRRGAQLPPHRLRFVGPGDFEQIGERFRDILIDLAGLRADSRVLDVGCGIGRMAIPLTRTLGPRGSYDGFDVVEEGIRWCHRNITPKHPNFRFTTIEVRNGVYRPRGRVDATALRFPYADASFDVVLLASVFTHMHVPAVAHYLHEIRRVLRPSGRALVTAFLLDDASRHRMTANTTQVSFDIAVDEHAMAVLSEQPEWAIAQDASWFLAATKAAGLALLGEVNPGAWRGGEPGIDFQDIAVLRRVAS